MHNDISISQDCGSKHSISIVMLGDSSVGKTSLVKTFADEPLGNNLISTIGVEQHSTVIKYKNMNYKIKIWDTCGQERLRSISKNYIRSGDGLILVYDLNNERTYNSLDKWLHDIMDICREGFPLVIAENKNDLERMVSQESREELKNKYPDIPILETSIIDKELVNKCFMTLIEMIVENLQNETIGEEKENNEIKELEKMKDKTTSCCK